MFLKKNLVAVFESTQLQTIILIYTDTDSKCMWWAGLEPLSGWSCSVCDMFHVPGINDLLC